MTENTKTTEQNKSQSEGGCCPYCSANIEKIFACHPLSSGAGEYYVCDDCGATFEPYEYEELENEE